ncbi:TNT domain-containing protein [Curtobacterium flaccumfaciens pv. flaccumfaciens]|uniref:TNT domain-containing protein n=1 Tax=Curtobacterium flaccumfaciens TaxID=2035 RepID=UPI00265A6801|nr:TNT domain-containing protein [Curtobacterium flaccumfaciens]MCS5508111.1 TNT domain-containing protein [Curtobacterium flaccumfaciens pv. flaccumfaciens]MCX2785272.1 TNT domain-containing protein [Curtobacterium flaccumfaciens pv. flaccumfaciens]
MTGVVKTGAIPYTDVQLEAITSGAASLRTVASAVRDGTADIVTAWSGISGSYEGPSDQELFAVMTPIGPQGTTFGDDLDAAAKALDTFVTEVTPIVAALKAYVTRAEQLHRDVDAFTPKTATTEYGNNATVESWDQDETLTDENNAIINGVAAQVVAYQAAERTCANTIRGLSGLQPLHAMSGSGSDDALAYGYDKLPAGTKLPWGTASERKESCSEKTVDFLPNMLTGVAVDGIWGTVKGLGTLVGLDGTGFHLETAATSWSGVLALTGFNTKTMQKDPDLQREAWTQLGKATVGWDEWGRDPGRAAGQALWGIGSIVVPIVGQAGKLGAVGKVGEVAGAVGKAGKYLDLVDAGAWVSKGLTKVLPRLDELKTIMTKGVGDDAVGSTGRLADFKTGLGDYLHGRHGDTDVEVPPARTEADADVRAGSDANARADGGDATVHAPEREPALVGAGGRGEHGETATGDGGSTSGSHGGAGHGGDSVGHGGDSAGHDGSGHGTDAGHGTGAGSEPGDVPPPDRGHEVGPKESFGQVPYGDGVANHAGPGGGPLVDDLTRPGSGLPDGVTIVEHRGKPVDGMYGEPRPDHGDLNLAYAAPGDPLYSPTHGSDGHVNPATERLVTTGYGPDGYYGHHADGSPLTRNEYVERYVKPDGSPRYPGNDGAVAGTRIRFEDPTVFDNYYSTTIDRMGRDTGDYFSFPGTSYEQRGLPPTNLRDPYSVFHIDTVALRDHGYSIEVSRIDPAFAQPGGGLQVQIIAPDGAAIDAAQLLEGDLRAGLPPMITREAFVR